MLISVAETGGDRVCFVGLCYCDLLVRTACGWRVRSSTQARVRKQHAPPAAAL